MAHRRGSTRSLTSQVTHMMCESLALGESKHAAKKSGQNTQEKIYSLKSRDQTLTFFKQLTREIKERHPEIRMIRDIKEAHIQEFFDRHSDEWSARTCGQYLSLTRKFEVVANTRYSSCHLDFSGVTVHTWKETPETGRDHGMTREQAEAVIKNMSEDSCAAPVPAITLKIGTRLEEACGIKPNQVLSPSEKYPHGAVELTETKGGRIRTVPIQNEEDRRFFMTLKEQAIERNWPTLTAGIRPNTASKAIRASMDKCGLSKEFPKSGNHAIRKCFAREQYELRLAQGMNPKQAAGEVQDLLGHGKGHRAGLFRTYAGR